MKSSKTVTSLHTHASYQFNIPKTHQPFAYKSLNTYPELMTEKQVAEYLNISRKALQKSRYSGLGISIDFIRVGSLIRYPRSAVEQYISANTHRINSVEVGG